jgi:protein-tyrosine-phosphatase
MGVSAASCGINASTGDAPHPLAVRCAAKRGLDITAHRATHIDRFDVLVGDLVLSFEPGHHHVLKERLGEAPGVKLCLLGAWLIPVFPYFHDPDGVNERYFDVCFLRIDRAVRNLAAWLREGRSV